jgi:gamma-glutamyl hercynylcysteine S-oxide synthase
LEIIDIQYININGGEFIQGNNTNNFSFDNELPIFKNNVNDFIVSKYPITNYQFSLFMQDNGYNKEEYWDINGWLWIKENNIKKTILL